MSCTFISETALNISNTFRLLWEQHGTWTRITINSLVFNTPDKQANIDRLLRNPEDFENVFVKFYGPQVANQFNVLLTEHLVLAADLVNAAVAGNNQQVSQIRKRWFRNAVEIARFLSQINPFNNFGEWKEMLFEHLRLVEQEAIDLINSNFTTSTNTYDIMEEQILIMADLMIRGILQQFCII